MTNLDGVIRRFIDENLRLSSRDIQASAKSREWVLNRIGNVIANDVLSPQLLSSNPFINFGSYFKGTKVADVDEYDVLIVIDSGTGIFTRGGVELGYGVGTQLLANPKYRTNFLKGDGSGVSPSKLLAWLQSTVIKALSSFNVEAPIRDGEAVSVILKGAAIKMDLVPAGVFSRESGGDIAFFNIPNGETAESWTLTNPLADKQRFLAAAAMRAELKNVVRLCKFLRNAYEHEGVSSYLIETVVLGFAVNKSDWGNSIAFDSVGAILCLAEKLLSGTVLDPDDSSTNLISNEAEARAFAQELSDIVRVMLNENERGSDQEQVYRRIERAFKNDISWQIERLIGNS